MAVSKQNCSRSTCGERASDLGYYRPYLFDPWLCYLNVYSLAQLECSSMPSSCSIAYIAATRVVRNDREEEQNIALGRDHLQVLVRP